MNGAHLILLIRDFDDPLIDGVAFIVFVFNGSNKIEVPNVTGVRFLKGDAEIPFLPILVAEDFPLIEQHRTSSVAVGHREPAFVVTN